MIRFVALGGFLGAGKTTTMLAAAGRLEAAGDRVSVVTNDQGTDLVDSQLARDIQVSGRDEVTGGCFCCRFDDLTEAVRRLHDSVHPTVVLAEAVGSCTDLQSTVIRPLRQLYGDAFAVSPLTAVVDPRRYRALSRFFDGPAEPDLAYMYRHQLDEADIIAVNKADLIDPATREDVTADLAVRFPHAKIVTYSAARGDGLDELIGLWTDYEADPDHRPFPVDYYRYGAAEAELAWTNQTFALTAPRSLSLAEWTEAFLRAFGAACSDVDAVVGHVKVRVAAEPGAVKASLLAADGDPLLDGDGSVRAITAEVTLNARVQTAPEQLVAIIDRATEVAGKASGAAAGHRTGDVFRPGFPVPVHQM